MLTTIKYITIIYIFLGLLIIFNDIFREPYYNKPQLLRDRKYLLYIFIVALFWLPLNWNFLRRGDFSIFTRKHLH
mgnify:CR=1 FL=1